jgi:IS30 family transposase
MLMGRSASTISCELKRNALPKGGYKPGSADLIALSRCRRQSKLERLNPLGQQVRDRLAMGWSPEQIAGRLRLDGSEHVMSHESIYRFIYRHRVRPEKLYRYLPRAKANRGEGQSWRRPIVGDVISSAAVSRSKTGGLFMNAPKSLKNDKNLDTGRKT